MPDLSVIIVSYNTCDLLRNCLLSLRASVGPSLEIIVVDNASTDGSAAMVRSQFPEVKLLAQAINTWYCGGNNIGARAATADYALLLNPDTEVAPDALALMLRYLRENRAMSALPGSCAILTARSKQTCARRPDIQNLLMNYSVPGYLLPMLKRSLQTHTTYADWDRDERPRCRGYPRRLHDDAARRHPAG